MTAWDRALHALAVLVPASVRDEWRREWSAEIHQRRRALGSAKTAARLMGAAVHALWLRKEEWRADMIWQDARFGARMLVRRPAFAIVATLTLALGIGANTAIFSIVYGVLLKPLPYRDPDRLVQVWETNPRRNWTRAAVAPANVLDWRDRNHVFEDLAFYGAGAGVNDTSAWVVDYNAPGVADMERLRAVRVSANIFDVLGVPPIVGRAFASGENTPGRHRVIVLTHRFWQRRFGGDPGAVGSDLMMNGVAFRIIGVMPPEVVFPAPDLDFWVPLAINVAEYRDARQPHYLRAIARLKPGVTIAQARAELTSIAAALESEYPSTNAGMGVGVGPHQEWVVGSVRKPLLLFLAAVAVVLLIACVNIANLLLARANARARELAVRAAVGAGRLDLVRQLLIESALVAAIGALAGTFVAWALVTWFVAAAPIALPRLAEVTIDRAILLFVAATAGGVTLLFGALPAFHATRLATPAWLKGAGRSPAAGARTTRRALVVSEVALAVVLVSGAALVLRSFNRLIHVDPGFDPSSIVTLQVSLPRPYDSGMTDAALAAFFETAVDRVRALPGVRAAGASTVISLHGAGWTGALAVEGRPDLAGTDIRHKEIVPGYFEALGLPLVRGRSLDATDADALLVVVNRTLAKRFFGDGDPVGRRVSFTKPGDAPRWRTIVGVVADEKQDSLAAAVQPEVYQSIRRRVESVMTLVARTDSAPRAAGIATDIRGALTALDRNVAVFDVMGMTDVVSDSVARERFAAILLAGFAGAALVLAAIGIYGVIAFSVTRRIAEFGVRMALGATRRDVLRLVLAEGVALVGAGLAIGMSFTLAATRVLGGLLFDVRPLDPPALTAAVSFLALVALAACYLPARRATQIDPLAALRCE